MPRASTVLLDLQGHEDMSKRINAAPAVLRNKVLRPGFRAGARVVLGRAQTGAPRGRGRLAGGDWKVRATKRRHFIGATVLSPTRASLGIPAKAKGYYVNALELGWTPHGPARRQTVRESRAAYSRASRRQVGGSGHVPGRHFIRAALRGAPQLVFDGAANEMRARMETLGLLPTSAPAEDDGSGGEA